MSSATRVLAVLVAIGLGAPAAAQSDDPPADESAADETPVDETPVDETPADETPVVETPVVETAVVETPVDETTADETAADETAADETAAAPTTATEITAHAAPVNQASPAPATPLVAPQVDGDGELIEIVGAPPPGSQTALGEDALERQEQDDIHKILARVPGVYVRGEDGYGLRPNIGMRGAATERSAKIALMEDGVLIAPAPYSAPAAYYFPLVTRMAGIEVVKGPGAIVYGPNTVGGAVNLLGQSIPANREGYVDLGFGSDLYGKLHARAADRGERWGVLAEAVRVRSDGFKELDGGGETGFGKNDAQVVVRLNTDPMARAYHQLDLTLGYADETSHETYTGLTDSDFAASSQRRYAATQLDRMDWTHWRMRLTHSFELGAKLSVKTVAYRHDFHRAWGKIAGFVGDRDLAAILADPMAGSNAVYYAILGGEADSRSPAEALLLGTNDRSFVSQGVQTTLGATATTGAIGHSVTAGLRLHHDRADRIRDEDAYDMLGGELVRSDRPRVRVLDSVASTVAIAGYAKDEVRWGRLAVTPGLRVELISFDFEDELGSSSHSDSYAVFIPGLGVDYELGGGASLLAGVHRGFVPVSPAASSDVDPESSVNVEAGGRWLGTRGRADLIGFVSDYSNLKGSCTFSAGCSAEQEGAEFNGGRVLVGGVEARAAIDLELPGDLRAPLDATYTFTKSSFQSSFSSDFAGWGDVEEGDELPYLPAHQLSLGAALASSRFELGTLFRWHASSRDVAGQGEVADADRIDALMTIDLSAHVRLHRLAELYATCSNLTNEQVIVARRPYGVRPNAPRLFILGYKARF